MTQNAFENEKFYDEMLAGRSTPWKARALVILQDGEWHDREDVIRELADMVPPGVAWRHLEDARISQLQRNARLRGMTPEQVEKWTAEQEQRPQPNPTSAQIRKGQRAVVVASLGSSNRIIREKRDGRIMLMRVPLSERLLNSGMHQLRMWQAENG